MTRSGRERGRGTNGQTAPPPPPARATSPLELASPCFDAGSRVQFKAGTEHAGAFAHYAHAREHEMRC